MLDFSKEDIYRKGKEVYEYVDFYILRSSVSNVNIIYGWNW